MNTKALQLESRFSLPPNSLGYCGKNSAPTKFKRCIIKGGCDGVEEEVSKFIVLYPYLKTIAKITGKPIFSYEVAESYWIGNELLKKAKKADYQILLQNLARQGVPDFFIDELREKRPKKFIPSHLFQVLHVGVGKASHAVPFNIDSINNCMIRWGKLVRLRDNKAKVRLNSLKKSPSGYKLTKLEENHGFDKRITPGIKVEDTVAVHWKQVIKILTKDEEEKIEYWTKEVLNSLY